MSHPLFAFILCLLTSVTALASSPYAGEQTRPIKALSEREVDALLSGQGMGFARAAELNGYPGPKHVLELSEELRLDDEQLEATRALFDRMQVRAIELGQALVDAERDLDRQFANRGIDQGSLQTTLQRIASLQAELRGVHLSAHLEQAGLLSDEQRAAYIRLRGYGAHESVDHAAHSDH